MVKHSPNMAPAKAGIARGIGDCDNGDDEGGGGGVGTLPAATVPGAARACTGTAISVLDSAASFESASDALLAAVAELLLVLLVLVLLHGTASSMVGVVGVGCVGVGVVASCAGSDSTAACASDLERLLRSPLPSAEASTKLSTAAIAGSRPTDGGGGGDESCTPDGGGDGNRRLSCDSIADNACSVASQASQRDRPAHCLQSYKAWW